MVVRVIPESAPAASQSDPNLYSVVFGGTITAQIEAENAQGCADVPGVPAVVTRCIAVIDQHLHEMGIYRVSGNASHIQQLSVQCNENMKELDLSRTCDVHTLTGLLKLYFRELADPIFTDSMYPHFMAAAKITERNTRLSRLKELISHLPPHHVTTLHYLGTHLNRVAAQSEKNKMRQNNVAIVFAPTLLRRQVPTRESLVSDGPFQTTVIEEILRQLDWVCGRA